MIEGLDGVELLTLTGEDLEKFKHDLAIECGLDPTVPANCCIQCKQVFSDVNVHTPAGWRETQLSRLCEVCFDAVYEE